MHSAREFWCNLSNSSGGVGGGGNAGGDHLFIRCRFISICRAVTSQRNLIVIVLTLKISSILPVNQSLNEFGMTSASHSPNRFRYNSTTSAGAKGNSMSPMIENRVICWPIWSLLRSLMNIVSIFTIIKNYLFQSTAIFCMILSVLVW